MHLFHWALFGVLEVQEKITEKGICISRKAGYNVTYVQTAKYRLVDLYDSTQFKPNLTDADSRYSRSVPCPALPVGLLFDPTKQSQWDKLTFRHRYSLLLTHLTYLPVKFSRAVSYGRHYFTVLRFYSLKNRVKIDFPLRKSLDTFRCSRSINTAT